MVYTSQVAVVGKNPPANAGWCKRRSIPASIPRFDPWLRKIPWRRQWQSTPVFLPQKAHGRRTLAGCSPWGHTESDTTEAAEHAVCAASGVWLRPRSVTDFRGVHVVLCACSFSSYWMVFHCKEGPYFVWSPANGHSDGFLFEANVNKSVINIRFTGLLFGHNFSSHSGKYRLPGSYGVFDFLRNCWTVFQSVFPDVHSRKITWEFQCPCQPALGVAS